MTMFPLSRRQGKESVPEEVAKSAPKASRYLVFCDSPDALQDLLDSVQYYDFKDTIVIPPAGEGDKPVVCIIMEDPDERTRIALERAREKTKEVTSSLLRKTGALLEDWSQRIEASRKK